MPARNLTRGTSRQTKSRTKPSDTRSVLLFNKPFGVLCQFTDPDQRPTLADYIKAPGYYAAGRLDRDSEGLLLLTNDGQMQQRISHPRSKMMKTYLAQVEGNIDDEAIDKLNTGITLKDGPARAINAHRVDCPATLWPRTPPVRFRKQVPTSWIELSLTEGRNRQVRRMSAAVNFPTLRLIRTAIGPFSVWPLHSGEFTYTDTDAIALNMRDGD